jgi:prepilin-type N-terminal cleavage/methylation domain-containing protein
MRCFGCLRRNPAGFTLIELVIIILVLGILAAVAIPRYVDMAGEARESACKGALGGFRSAISIYYANAALLTGTATWPPMDSLSTIGVVLEQKILRNPYQLDDRAPDSIVTGVVKGITVGARGGWAYNPETGEIWPNTAADGENNF